MFGADEPPVGRRLLKFGLGRAEGVEGDAGVRIADAKIGELAVVVGDAGGRMRPGWTPSLWKAPGIEKYEVGSSVLAMVVDVAQSLGYSRHETRCDSM